MQKIVPYIHVRVWWCRRQRGIKNLISGGSQLVTYDSFRSCVDAVAERWGVAPTGEEAGYVGVLVLLPLLRKFDNKDLYVCVYVRQPCPDEWVTKTETLLKDEKSYSYYIKHFNMCVFGRCLLRMFP